MANVIYSDSLGSADWLSWRNDTWISGVSDISSPDADARLLVLQTGPLAGYLVRLTGLLSEDGNFADPNPTPLTDLIQGIQIYDRYEPGLSFDDVTGSVTTSAGAAWAGVRLVTVTNMFVLTSLIQSATNLADAIEANFGGSNDFIGGTGGNDVLPGYGGDDLISAGFGDDSVLGGAGGDQLYGGGGNDTIYGGNGDDMLMGGTGNNSLYGGSGLDFASYLLSADSVTVRLGIAGPQFISASQGNDLLQGIEGVVGSQQNDLIFGNAGDNFLVGALGDDRIVGGAGNDTLLGGLGNDTLGGGTGEDALFGEAGNDDLYGGAMGDTIRGGSGNDRIWGDGGSDLLAGEAGADAFVYRAVSDSTLAQRDTITDFTSGTDRVFLNLIDANTGAAGNQAIRRSRRSRPLPARRANCALSPTAPTDSCWAMSTATAPQI